VALSRLIYRRLPRSHGLEHQIDVTNHAGVMCLPVTPAAARAKTAGGYAIMCGRLRGLWAHHHGQSAFNTARYSSKVDVYSLVRQDAKNKVHGQKYFRRRRDFGFVPHL